MPVQGQHAGVRAGFILGNQEVQRHIRLRGGANNHLALDMGTAIDLRDQARPKGHAHIVLDCQRAGQRLARMDLPPAQFSGSPGGEGEFLGGMLVLRIQTFHGVQAVHFHSMILV